MELITDYRIRIGKSGPFNAYTENMHYTIITAAFIAVLILFCLL